MSTTAAFVGELQAIADRFVEGMKQNHLIGRFARGTITRDEYVTFMQQAYHYVKVTTPNLATASSSVRRWGGPDKAILADRLAEHAREEAGHHEWILDDLEALGEPRDRIFDVPVCPPIQAYLAYFGHIANSRHAAGFFGQAFLLEGGAVRSADLMIDALVGRSGIPNVKNAVKFFELHGVVDVAHVDELMQILDYVTDPDDQHAAVLCADVTGQLWLDLADYVDEVCRSRQVEQRREPANGTTTHP